VSGCPYSGGMTPLSFFCSLVCLAGVAVALFFIITLLLVTTATLGPSSGLFIGLVVAAVGSVAALLYCFLSPAGFCGSRTVHVTDLKGPIYDYWAERGAATRGVPDHLRGIFWMSGNYAQELVFTLDGARVNAAKRMLTIYAYQRHTWTVSTNFWGYLIMLLATTVVCGTRVTLTFDEGWEKADIRLYSFCGLIRVPLGILKFERKSDNVWKRNTFSNEGDFEAENSYTAYRVIDHNGDQVAPYFDMMVKSTQPPGLEGYPLKTPYQVYSTIWC